MIACNRRKRTATATLLSEFLILEPLQPPFSSPVWIPASALLARCTAFLVAPGVESAGDSLLFRIYFTINDSSDLQGLTR